MVRDIMRDTFFLSQEAAPAAKENLAVAQDLLDTPEGLYRLNRPGHPA